MRKQGKVSIFYLKTFDFGVFCIFLFWVNICVGQVNFPKNYFAAPLDGELMINGSFGELRTNHLHSGIDLKTDKEGTFVHAAAGGYISRIKISSNGFGKAIYITHPNGFVTLYAHLSKFIPNVEAYVKEQQYKKESFEIELFPSPFEFPVLKSEQIAFSGNTGSSGGPHLHFEIRDANTEEVLNPLLFGFKIRDHEAPIIEKLIIYPYGNSALINASSNPLKLNIEKNEKGIYVLKSNEKIQLQGKFYIGIETHDKELQTQSTNGIYSLSLKLDEREIYTSEMNRFSFSVSRFINAHIDYGEKIKNKSDIQLCYLMPNNKLPVYKNVINKGIIEFKKEGKHFFEIKAEDSFGNFSILRFEALASPFKTIEHKALKDNFCTKIFKYEISNHFEDGPLKVYIPANALYDSLCFNYGGKMIKKGFLSEVYRIHDIYTPLQNYIEISIHAEIPEKLRSKVLLARIDEKSEIVSEGGSWKEGVVMTRSRNFGDYGIVADTIPPSITPLFPGEDKNNDKKIIKLKIDDKLSGIKSYRGTVDGNWILMEYDEKTGIISYEKDARIIAGKHIFELTVFDNKGNVGNFERNLNLFE